VTVPKKVMKGDGMMDGGDEVDVRGEQERRTRRWRRRHFIKPTAAYYCFASAESSTRSRKQSAGSRADDFLIVTWSVSAMIT
jgi:hypothetical protein